MVSNHGLQSECGSIRICSVSKLSAHCAMYASYLAPYDSGRLCIGSLIGTLNADMHVCVCMCVCVCVCVFIAIVIL